MGISYLFFGWMATFIMMGCASTLACIAKIRFEKSIDWRERLLGRKGRNALILNGNGNSGNLNTKPSSHRNPTFGEWDVSEPTAVTETEGEQTSWNNNDPIVDLKGLFHFVIIPNYKIKESLISECISKCFFDEEFCREKMIIVLAMDGREGKQIVKEKASRLLRRHRRQFKDILINIHDHREFENELKGKACLNQSGFKRIQRYLTLYGKAISTTSGSGSGSGEEGKEKEKEE